MSGIIARPENPCSLPNLFWDDCKMMHKKIEKTLLVVTCNGAVRFPGYGYYNKGGFES
jgi:hypothetical protein